MFVGMAMPLRHLRLEAFATCRRQPCGKGCKLINFDETKKVLTIFRTTLGNSLPALSPSQQSGKVWQI